MSMRPIKYLGAILVLDDGSREVGLPYSWYPLFRSSTALSPRLPHSPATVRTLPPLVQAMLSIVAKVSALMMVHKMHPTPLDRM